MKRSVNIHEAETQGIHSDFVHLVVGGARVVLKALQGPDHPADVLFGAERQHTGDETATTVFTIHYSKKGTHIVPDYPSRKGTKQTE